MAATPSPAPASEPSTTDAPLERLAAHLGHPLLWPARHVDDSPALAALPLIFWLMAEYAPERVLSDGDRRLVAHLGFLQAVEALELDTACVVTGAGPLSAPARERLARLGAERSSLIEEGGDPGRGFDIITIELGEDEVEAGARIGRLTDRLTEGGALVLYGAGLEEALVSAEPAIGRGLVVIGEDRPRLALRLRPGAPDVLAELAALSPDSAPRRSVARAIDRIGEGHRLILAAGGAGDRAALAIQDVAAPPSRHGEDVERLVRKLAELDEERLALCRGRPVGHTGPIAEAGPAALPVEATASLSERVQDLEAQVAFLQHRLDEEARELRAIRTSTSWRITAPIRAVVRALRRLRGG